MLGRAEGALGWAEYHRAAGDLAEAREHATAALTHASAPRQPLALLATHRLLGELTTASGQHDEAAAHLAEALALAELHAATSEHEAASTVLAEARALLEPLGAMPARAR